MLGFFGAPRLERAPRRIASRRTGFERLETRAVLTATYSASGSEFIIDLNSAGDLNISSTGTSYLFTLTNGSGGTNTWSGTGTASVSGANLTANAASLAAYDTFTIRRSANFPRVQFLNSTGSYADNFNLSMSNGTLNRSGCITFDGTTTFANNGSLRIVTDYHVAMLANSTLTMTNGNLDMSINMQATSSVMELSGLMVDSNATIQTNGTGQTTIEARGGNGVSSTVQNLHYNKGVAVINGGKIIGGTTGSLSITGYSYNNLTLSASNKINGQGVFVYSSLTTNGMSTITSRGANVVVTGYGANDITANTMAPGLSTSCITNAGVVVGGPTFTTANDIGGLITSGGNGTVTVSGYGGSLADQPTINTFSSDAYAKSIGVLVTGGNATITSGGAGLVSVTGFGGGATANTICGTGVAVYSGNIKSGANGSVVVNGTGFMNGTQQGQVGIYVYGPGCISTGAGTGNVTVTGQGGGTGNIAGFNYGVFLQSGGTITAGGSGNVTVTGRGGLSQSGNNKGIIMSGGSAITSNGGDVLVTGYGGTGNAATSTGTFTHGVEIATNSRITAGGLGDVTVAGHGGNHNGTGGTQNHGVLLTSFGSNQLPGFITSGGGNVTVLGTGGGGNENSTATRPMGCNTGVCIACGSYITVGGTGNVAVTGQGGGRSSGANGSNNFGVYVGDGNRTTFSANNMAYSYIGSSGGQVSVTGSGGGGSGNALSSTSANNYGVLVEKAGTITSGGNADVIITGTGGSFGNSSSSGGGNYGVSVTGAVLPTNAPVAYRSTVTTGGSGNVTINGNGGGSGLGSVNVGILVSTGALVTAGGASSSVTLNGQGGNTTGAQNYGVCITNTTNNFPATVTSNGGNVSITGCGPLATAGSAQYGIYLFTNGTVSSGGNGSVTLTGRGGTGDVGTIGTGHVGVILVTNATITSGGTGPVLINGYGGGSGARAGNYGVYLNGASVIGGGDTAPVTVNGYGGNADGNGTTNTGVYLTGRNTKITSNNGTVLITGIGGQTNTTGSGSSTNYGVHVESGAEASSTGTAPITVNGTGGGLGTGNASTNHGVSLSTLGTGNTTPKIASAGGLVTVTGTAGGLNGNGSLNHGVSIASGGLIRSTGSGTAVSITGIGGGGSNATAQNHGIFMGGTANASNYTITANGGNISLNGTEGTGSGSQGLAANTTVASVIGDPNTRGNITLVTNSADLATTAGSAINASPQLTIRPRTAGVAIDLGNTTGAANGPLAISAAEIANFNAPSIQLGNSSTGNVTISAGVTVPTGSNLTLVSNGTGSVLSSTLATTNLTMGAGKTLDVSTLPVIGTTINGTTLGTGYSQLKVVGDLSIAGKTLSLSGSYTPVAGDVFTIVNASSLTGTFTGLANGSSITYKNRTLIVNYTSTAVTLTEPSPKVTNQPTSQTVSAGATVTFNAAATGIPAPSVQWQVLTPGGLWSNITNATSPTYSFTAAAGDNSNQYRAYFSNTYGDDLSTAVTLTVQNAPSITTQPTSQTVNEGQTATFTAAASGTPTPTVQWQVSTNGGSSWSDIAGATSTTYSFTAASADDSYQYRAVFTNSVGSANSSAATLTVNSGSTPAAPFITLHPSNTTVTTGSTASFTAAATGSPTPTVQWQVSTNGGSNWSNISGATNTTYSFTAASGDNTNQYRAVFSNGVGSDATSNAATLTVNYAPSVTQNPSSSTVTAGSTASFTAAATGNPTPTVQWQVSTNGGSNWSNISGATNTTYSFTAASGENTNQYRAVFSNGIGSDATSNAATLTINYAPSVTQNPSSSTVTAGSTASFTAAATGNPTPTVQWQVSTNGGSNWSNISGATNATYSFTAASGDNTNQYRAVFTNGVGSDATSSAATLTVNYAPSVTQNPSSTTVTPGDTASFTAAAIGNPTPTVQWQVSTNGGSSWSDISGATNTTYSFSTVSGDNGNQYRAVFTNSLASTNSTSATLNVSSPSAPSVTAQPSNTGVEAGQTASFSAAASGNPSPSVQWQSSVNGTDWTDVNGATSTTYSFSASAGDNGRYYRAVFTNTQGSANTNSAQLVVGVTPVFTSPTAMTLAEGLTSGLTVKATGTPAPALSISGTLPTGVTFNPATGLLSGTAAAGTAGSYPLTLQANNGVNGTVTQNFVMTVTADVTGFDLSKGQTQRSYIRYIDLTLANSTLANTLASNLSRLQLTKSSLTGDGASNVPIPTSVVSVVGNQLKLDFGASGIGASRNSSNGDGYFTLGVDLNNDGVYDTKFFFYRLFGDVNGDRIVDATDESLVTANAITTVPYNANYDLNGDGVVNGSDVTYVRRALGRQLGSGLLITD